MVSVITYRPATSEDFDFLFRLHEAAMRAYVEETFGPWDAEWQAAYYRKNVLLADLRIIQFEGQPVGALSLQERTEELFLANLEILPAYQGRGIGTLVMKDLLKEAARLGKPVALQVLKVNRRARDLYQRLGFGVTGENDTHYILAHEKTRDTDR